MSDTLSGVLRPSTNDTFVGAHILSSATNKTVSGVLGVSPNDVPTVSQTTANPYPKLDSQACLELMISSQEDRLISEMTNDTTFDDFLASLNIPNTQQNTQPSCVQPVNNTVNMQSTMSNFQSFAGLPTINNYGNINISYNIIPK